ncbi:MAG: hypothetical protein M3O31_03885 [Acidobacteriota bacterium]|nr:hypothetical protein [Acidobacteriota bacterium]
MGNPIPLPPALKRLKADRPKISFSDVLSLDLNGEAIHVVHQHPGFSNADAIAHFHVGNLVYMGEDFPGDGYPRIDQAQSGRLEGMIETLSAWTDKAFRIVPARGAVTDGDAVKSFVAMLTAIQGRVQALIRQGKSEDQIVAIHPTLEFDKRWGRGRVSADSFVRDVYKSLVSQR